MNAIVLALGGLRATVFAVLALLFLGVSGLQTWRLVSAKAAHEAYRANVIKAANAAKVASAQAAQAAATAREDYYKATALAESSYEAGRESANNAQQILISDLRNDRVRLRQQWQGCVAASGKAVGPAASGSDADAELRETGAADLIGAADRADLWVIRLQSHLTNARALYETCNKPLEVAK